jgi:hypothetical protein
VTLEAALEMMSLEEPESWTGRFDTGRPRCHVVHLDGELDQRNIFIESCSVESNEKLFSKFHTNLFDDKT